MATYQSRRPREAQSWIPVWFMDHAKTVLQLSLVVTIALYGYLLYGLFSGQMVNVPHLKAAEQARILENIQHISLGLNCSLVVLLATAVILYYEGAALGFILLLLSAFLAYGLQYSIDTLFASEASQYVRGPASEMTLHELWLTGILIGIPGVLLVLRNLCVRMFRRGDEDLTVPAHNQNRVQDDIHRPLFGAFAKCWQMPFCREGIRKNCPIYHASTKCWKERVGCVCEPHIITLNMDHGPTELSKAASGGAAGFVPIGDLLTSSKTERLSTPTRPGPRGVRIPHNPHMSEGQKRERCRNCLIYKEHQRHKFNLLAPIVTLLVPLLVYLNFDALRVTLANSMNSFDRVVGNLSFSANAGGTSTLTRAVTGSLPIEVIILVCATLVLMTWALRLLEYCVYKIQI